MRIETFYFQAFIEAEGRGGTYHVVLMTDDGKAIGPMTPSDADKLGFPLSSIFADIDTQLAAAVDDARAKAAKAERQAEIAIAAAKGADEILQKAAEHLPDEAREIIAADIVALNKTLSEMSDPVQVAPIEGAKA